MSTSPSPSPLVLQELALTADPTESPVAWPVVLSIPFGPAPGEVEYEPSNESAPVGPSSFAVAEDGSFWILDAAKRRLAHFGADGTYRSSVALPLRTPDDVVMAGSHMYLTLDESEGRLAEVGARGRLRPFTVSGAGRALFISPLYGSSRGLMAYAHGFADSYGAFRRPEGPRGYGTVDVRSGAFTSLPGLPFGPGQWGDVSSDDNGVDLGVQYSGAQGSRIQPIRVDLVPGIGLGTKRYPSSVGAVDLIGRDGDLTCMVRVSPSRSSDYDRVPQGRWLLRIGRSPLLWERLPDPGIPDDGQRRHLVSGPDGAIFLMVLDQQGVHILRRP